MLPDLFTLGPLTIHTYGLFVALGFLVGLTVAVMIGKGEGINARQVLDMSLLMILAAIIGSRGMYVLVNLSQYQSQPLDILKIWEGGLVFAGGIICVLFFIAYYAIRHHFSFLKLGDLWAPAVAIGQGIGRIGCFMAGCCYGLPTESKWGMVFTHPHCLAPLNVHLHPTQLYSAASGFAIFVVLLILHSRKKFEGQVFLWFLILHSTARLAVERFRGDDRGVILGSNMSVSQLVAILALTAAIITLFILKSKKTSSLTPRRY